MPGGSPFEAKERVKSATDIVDLVTHYGVALRREGRAFKGLCPWHDDSRPSLRVNPERQSWKCWVCDIGGDVFDFVMRREGVAFPEALRMLADRAGIALEASGGGPSQRAGTADEKRALYQAAAWAEQQFCECLARAPEAEPARKYLEDRGITPDSAQRFHVGFSPPSWDWLLTRARSAASGAPSPPALEAVGLVARRSTGSGYYDRFRGRVLFSIRDAQGRPVGVGGRVLPGLAGENEAKYINSPDTPLFHKHRLLYGLDVARDVLSRGRTAIVMEGYTDVIVAHQCGVPEAVAVLGTALGAEHIQLLARYVERVLLVLDGDEAGQRRSREVLELFMQAPQVDLRIATLPGGQDPCDFLLASPGAPGETFREIVAAAIDAPTFALEVETRGVDPADIHGTQQALERVLAVLARAPRLAAGGAGTGLLREQKTLERLAFLARVPEADLRHRLTELRRRHAAKPATAGGSAESGAPPARIPQAERMLLELLLQQPSLVPRALQTVLPEDFESSACRAVLQRCAALDAAGQTADFQRLMLELDDPQVRSLLVELDETGHDKQLADVESHFARLMESYRRRRADRELRQHASLLRQPAADDAAQRDVLDRIVNEQRNRQGISPLTDG